MPGNTNRIGVINIKTWTKESAHKILQLGAHSTTSDLSIGNTTCWDCYGCKWYVAVETESLMVTNTSIINITFILVNI